MVNLKAGVARVCITPPIGVELAGYGPFLSRRSETIHDDLYAEALVLDDGSSRVAIVTSDLIACDEAFVAAVRGQAALATGITPDHIMVSCIHSHTAPTACAFRVWGARDEQYLALLTRHLAGAISAAARQVQPAKIGCGRGEHQDLAWYRLHDGTDGHVDSTVMVLRVDDAESGKPLAILSNHACHAVMLGPKTAISADYPGALRRHVETALPGCIHMFANSACGDIDPVSNRDVWGQASFDDVDRAGAALAAQVVETASRITTKQQASIRCAQTHMELPLETMTLDEAQAELKKREDAVDRIAKEGGSTSRDLKLAEFWLLWARDLVNALQHGLTSNEQQIELQAIQINDAVLIALPAEVFTTIGTMIRAESPWPHAFLVTYANGCVGYIPDENDYKNNGYAARRAPAIYNHLFGFRSDVGSVLAAGVAELLNMLK
ncbi:MAG: hypothetical protein GX620_04350 [Chloroflexi bacterium]|nr:hypothetical protein [Chloroflexota bacterium]